MTDDERRTPPCLGYELGAQDAHEAADFEEIAAELGLAADPVEPRPELKAALFARLAETPQLPADSEAAPENPVAPAPTPVAPPAPASAAPESAPAAPAPTPAEERARRRWFQRPGAILASAAAAVLIFIGGAFLGSSLAGNDSYQSQQASALAELNAAGDVQRATADVTGGGTATLVWSAQLGKSAVVTNGLPALPGDKTYELWYISGGKATPAGTMDPAASGSTWRVLTGEMKPGVTIGMTVEPHGGSDQPTTQPIVAIQAAA